ncbi:hypothetical protein NQ318_008281 [Aromia moschata]|uniref:Uncharacterized protein n=1 Tax=Aromia moschata TaxID=1265417 RepID=A0AAV8XJT1_9CUCU|nr:hypothetical protein NQ318_008281 [Aromia moschata]
MKSDDRRMNDDDRRTVRRQNDDDTRTVRRQKGERKSDDRKGRQNRNDDDNRDGADRRHQKICESQQVINTRLNEFSGRIDDVEQQMEQVGIKVNRIEKEFQNNKDWDKLVSLFLLTYRSSQHESTTYTPSMLTSGREMKLPTDLILGRPLEENQERFLPGFLEDLQERMDRIHRFAREQLKIHSDKMNQHLDTHQQRLRLSLVMQYGCTPQKGRKEKSNWEGPYTIIKKINDLVYRIQLSPRIKPKVVHLERLAKYTGHNPPKWFVVEDPPPWNEDSYSQVSSFFTGMGNMVLNVSLIVETVVACMLSYLPHMNYLKFYPILFRWWCYSFPFAIMIFLFDEARKWHIRKFPNSWYRKETYY